VITPASSIKAKEVANVRCIIKAVITLPDKFIELVPYPPRSVNPFLVRGKVHPGVAAGFCEVLPAPSRHQPSCKAGGPEQHACLRKPAPPGGA
jgi:hypothetical protein